jgi:hypothetical protein
VSQPQGAASGARQYRGEQALPFIKAGHVHQLMPRFGTDYVRNMLTQMLTARRQ